MFLKQENAICLTVKSSIVGDSETIPLCGSLDLRYQLAI